VFGYPNTCLKGVAVDSLEVKVDPIKRFEFARRHGGR